MVLWLYARPDCRADLRISLDRGGYLAMYAEFDRFVARAGADARTRALYDLLTDDPAPLAAAAPPPLRTVLGALHATGYDADRAIADLTAPGTRPDRAAVAERVGHALAWLASHGRDNCWLPATPPSTTPAPDTSHAPDTTHAPDANPADPLVDGGLAGPWDRPRHRALLLALFGVESGPPLRRLLATFGQARLVAAVRAYQTSRERPLRRLVAGNLDTAGRRDTAGGGIHAG